MRIVIFGLGSIGSRHARILLRDFDHELAAFRSRPDGVKNTLGIREIFSWSELRAWRPDIALIANPTDRHLATALKCAQEGLQLFVEKPLASDLKGLPRLKQLVSQKRLTVYVAYCLRFHPVIKQARELLKGRKVLHVRSIAASYLPDWRGYETYSAFKTRGGGVLLDLSHELDYVSYLFGRIKTLGGAFGRRTAVTRDAEDYADLVATTERGVPAAVSLDYFSRRDERTFKVDLADGYLYGDLAGYRLESVAGGRKQVFRYKADRDGYLREQWRYFFAHLGGKKIMNDLAEAGGLLAKIEELKHG